MHFYHTESVIFYHKIKVFWNNRKKLLCHFLQITFDLVYSDKFLLVCNDLLYSDEFIFWSAMTYFTVMSLSLGLQWPTLQWWVYLLVCNDLLYSIGFIFWPAMTYFTVMSLSFCLQWPTLQRWVYLLSAMTYFTVMSLFFGLQRPTSRSVSSAVTVSTTVPIGSFSDREPP